MISGVACGSKILFEYCPFGGIGLAQGLLLHWIALCCFLGTKYRTPSMQIVALAAEKGNITKSL